MEYTLFKETMNYAQEQKLLDDLKLSRTSTEIEEKDWGFELTK